MRRSSASCTARSLSASRADVASSSSRIGASLRMARAMAMRWRWPPDSVTPRSPICVAKPCGKRLDEGVGARRARPRAAPPLRSHSGGRSGYCRGRSRRKWSALAAPARCGGAASTGSTSRDREAVDGAPSRIADRKSAGGAGTPWSCRRRTVRRARRVAGPHLEASGRAGQRARSASDRRKCTSAKVTVPTGGRAAAAARAAPDRSARAARISPSRSAAPAACDNSPIDLGELRRASSPRTRRRARTGTSRPARHVARRARPERRTRGRRRRWPRPGRWRFRSGWSAALVDIRAASKASSAAPRETPGRRRFHAEGLHRCGRRRPPRPRRRPRRRAGPARPATRRRTERPESDERQHDQRDGDEDKARQLRAGPHHERDGADEQDHVAERDRDARAEGGLDLRRVGREPRNDVAAPGRVEEGGIEAGQVAEHGGAQVRDDALAERDDEVVAERARGREDARRRRSGSRNRR